MKSIKTFNGTKITKTVKFQKLYQHLIYIKNIKHIKILKYN